MSTTPRPYDATKRRERAEEERRATRRRVIEAARDLFVTRGYVATTVADIAKEAGVALLSKAGRRVQLTPQAEILVARTTELLDVLERTESDLAASLSTVTGTVRVAVFQSAARPVRAPRL